MAGWNGGVEWWGGHGVSSCGARADEAELEQHEIESAQSGDDLARARRELADAQEEQLRLMKEVATLRAALAGRDDELRRAIASKDFLVQQVAALDGAASTAHTASKPRGRR